MRGRSLKIWFRILRKVQPKLCTAHEVLKNFGTTKSFVFDAGIENKEPSHSERNAMAFLVTEQTFSKRHMSEIALKNRALVLNKVFPGRKACKKNLFAALPVFNYQARVVDGNEFDLQPRLFDLYIIAAVVKHKRPFVGLYHHGAALLPVIADGEHTILGEIPFLKVPLGVLHHFARRPENFVAPERAFAIRLNLVVH